ncbi:hypothetical protein [Acetobacter pasteurianus]|nr:hypothetical protein [Acetobacter pasteurianus]
MVEQRYAQQQAAGSRQQAAGSRQQAAGHGAACCRDTQCKPGEI